MSELKPCPFCGGKVKLVEGDEAAYIQCMNVSGHRAIPLTGDNAIADEVVEMWNTRADIHQAAIDAAVKATVEEYEHAILAAYQSGFEAGKAELVLAADISKATP